MSRIEVPMPQMGESIAEGTVSKWLKEVGDAVERDEPILEISTDKVDAEIPSPSAGALTEILVAEGETVEVGTIVAYIDPNGAGGAASAPVAPDEPEPSPAAEPPPPAPATSPPHDPEDVACTATSEERLRTRSTPVVRRIAAEAGVDISRVTGTGHQGRVTKQDILAYIESGPDTVVAPAPAPAGPTTEPALPAAPATAPREPTPLPTPPPAAPSGDDLWHRFAREVDHPVFPVREEDRVETMDKVRRLTAEHMVLSKRIHSHVHSIIEIDFSVVDRIRRENKARWAKRGARVSYTAFVAWACSRILRDFPTVNGVLSGNNVIYRGSVNLGMAVDLNPGLIVPVIHDADDLSLVGTARKIIDLATRAKDRQLSPSEIQGATFTITNPGVLGTMVGMPIIPKGTSAILGTGSIEKRVVVLTDPGSGQDSMAIRKRSYFSLGYDHRLVDGADSARFLSALKELLEDFPEDA
ncbi:MAG: dihydrolipoamide acetyltransferase family protein [Gemmatimonadota bacterium]|nr:dihydrolipoamide acetyltransferase family protein [Gemmatimonadota bacterium]MDE2984118.1 dihydrolipoamide acetyltransferase family protein [Gemmatimonadota bacterium]